MRSARAAHHNRPELPASQQMTSTAASSLAAGSTTSIAAAAIGHSLPSLFRLAPDQRGDQPGRVSQALDAGRSRHYPLLAMVPPPSRPALPALTSLRFLAAAAIVWLHVGGVWNIPVGRGINLGFGVSFFFVLSGFILTYRYDELRARIEIIRFLRARVARIWPAHIAALALVVATMTDVFSTFPVYHHLVPVLISNTLIVQAWLPFDITAVSLNGPSWSISTEFAFYLMFPWLSRNLYRTWHYKLALAVGVAISIDIFCRLLDLNTSNGGWTALTAFPLSRMPEFVLGMCAALVWRNLDQRPKRLGLWAATAIETAAIGLLALTILSPSPLLSHVNLGTAWPIGFGIPALAAAILILAMAGTGGLFSRALAARPFVFLGEISYSVYLLHAGIAVIILTYLPELHSSPLRDAAGSAVYVSAVLFSSTAMWLFIECPARRLIVSGRLRPAKTPAPEGPASSAERPAVAL